MSRKSIPFRATGGELRDLDQPGYYPGYSTMRQKESWDPATQKVVSRRLSPPPPIRFFSPPEAALLTAITDRLIPQDDRSESRTIPIVPLIDERLYNNTLHGFRYQDMPPDQEAYRLAIKTIDEMAKSRFEASFVDLPVHRQELILKSIHDGKPDPGHSTWERMPVHRFWSLLMEDCVAAYYSHPWAWDEIGFGGPAYPRGYMRLENGLPEPWEKNEQRHEWSAPVDSVSVLDEQGTPPEHESLHGHGGTH